MGKIYSPSGEWDKREKSFDLKHSLCGMSDEDLKVMAKNVGTLSRLIAGAYGILISELNLDRTKFHGYEWDIASKLADESMEISGPLKQKFIYMKSRLANMIEKRKLD
jgi:hypothetical protein